jgi:hypothetical protein
MKKSYLIGSVLMMITLFLSSCNPIARLAGNPEVTKWEMEVSDLGKMPVSKDDKTILFTGSSSIRLWETISTDMLPYQAIARGYGGAKLSDFVYYTQRLVGPHQSGAIAVFIANDITGDSHDILPEEVLSLFKTTVRQIRKDHSKTPVFWIEITPTPSRWGSWEQINRANLLIRDYTDKKKNLYFIPTSHQFINDNGLPDESLFMPDLLHLNDKGYRLWSESIKQELDRYVPQLRVGNN